MAQTLLNAATATGTGTQQKTFSIPTHHTVVARMGGTVVATAVTVSLEGSLVGGATANDWFTLASHAFTAAEITAEGAMFHIADKPVKYVRGNLVTLTAGTDPTVTVLYEQATRTAT